MREMSRRSPGWRVYAAVFSATFILTFLLLRESKMTAPTVAQQGSARRLFRENPREEAQETSGHQSSDRETPDLDPEQKLEQGKAVKSKLCPPNSPRYVILLTYGRSGSSLTTDIISEHPDVFTYWEPLHNLAKSFDSRQKQYRIDNNRYLHLTDIQEYNSAAVKMLEKQMTCDYYRLNRFATLNLHAPTFESTKELYHCVKSALTSRAEEECLQEGQDRCERKPIRFIKTIRLSVELAASLIEAHPCSKMVYLIRDPRGSYHSKTKMFASHGQNVTFDAERFCSRLNKDVDAVIKLKEKYPDRILMTRFETIATHPIISTKNIYDFIGLEFTKSIAMFVYKKTHSKTAGRGYSTDRADSLEACYKWRKSIPFSDATAFDNFCSEPFFKLGYIPANSLKELRDLNRTLLFHTEHFS